MEDHLEVVLLLEEVTLQVLLALEDIVQDHHQIADHVHLAVAHLHQEEEATQEEVAVSVKIKKETLKKVSFSRR